MFTLSVCLLMLPVFQFPNRCSEPCANCTLNRARIPHATSALPTPPPPGCQQHPRIPASGIQQRPDPGQACEFLRSSRGSGDLEIHGRRGRRAHAPRGISPQTAGKEETLTQTSLAGPRPPDSLEGQGGAAPCPPRRPHAGLGPLAPIPAAARAAAARRADSCAGKREPQPAPSRQPCPAARSARSPARSNPHSGAGANTLLPPSVLGTG